MVFMSIAAGRSPNGAAETRRASSPVLHRSHLIFMDFAPGLVVCSGPGWMGRRVLPEPAAFPVFGERRKDMNVLIKRVRVLVKRPMARRRIGAVSVVFAASIATAFAQVGSEPPFDFSNAHYLANGINPANIVMHVNGTCPLSDKPSCSVIDTSNTDPDRSDIRVLSTTGGFDREGNPLYYNIYGMVMPNTFTNDAAGAAALAIANSFEAYIFPKASGNPLSPDLSNRRQDNLFDTGDGYFERNPLGLWSAVFVSYLPAAFNTDAGQKILAALAAKNGTDLDGTPIIRHVKEIDFLERMGLATEQRRKPDGSQ